MADFDDVVRLSADWPGVRVHSWYGTPGVLVGTTVKNGKGFCRMWSEREHDRDDVHDTDVLVVLCDLEEKEALLGSAQGVLFSTPHYEGHGSMLVRMADVELDDLRDWLEDSYRRIASAKLIADLDGQQTDQQPGRR